MDALVASRNDLSIAGAISGAFEGMGFMNDEYDGRIDEMAQQCEKRPCLAFASLAHERCAQQLIASIAEYTAKWYMIRVSIDLITVGRDGRLYGGHRPAKPSHGGSLQTPART